MRAGRDTVPAHIWNNVRADTWFFLKITEPMGHTPSTKIDDGYYNGPIILVDHAKKALTSLWTDRVRAKVSYSTITQTMMLNMSPTTKFTMLYQIAMGTM